MAAKIKKGDKVVVLTGKHRGEEAVVTAVMPKEDRVLLKGVNVVAKHQRQTATSRGGIVREEAPIHISNVALSVGGKPSRVGFKKLDDGRKVRVARRSGEVIDG
ncbi:MAG: 50S ribosomal protein L24 [Alphaproteobacteria bacterium RIFCSPHIGHO2_12_FULL_63_12]|nr:MAG: 50S ribosomal protein L24 [Alphaproteobacteria bacterium RIFCSPHIGHO2_12_FULL_63_12]